MTDISNWISLGALIVSIIALVKSHNTQNAIRKSDLKVRLADELYEVRISQGKIEHLIDKIKSISESFKILCMNALTLLNTLKTSYETQNLPFPDDLAEDLKTLENTLTKESPLIKQTDEAKEQLKLNELAIQRLTKLDNPTTEDITTVIALKAVDQRLIIALEEKIESLQSGNSHIMSLITELTALNKE